MPGFELELILLEDPTAHTQHEKTRRLAGL